MSVNATESRETAATASFGDRAMDAARHAAHLSHEARLVRSMAADAIEDGVHAARRAMKSLERGVERLGDFKQETAYQVKRRPFTAIGLAAGVGLLAGIFVGAIGFRLGQRRYLKRKMSAGC